MPEIAQGRRAVNPVLAAIKRGVERMLVGNATVRIGAALGALAKEDGQVRRKQAALLPTRR
jgi:hypothetical protein